MYKEIIEKENLTCSEAEFKDYLDTLSFPEVEENLNELQPDIKEFTELYNWVQIENPANWELYYTLKVEGRMFLQNIVPYVGWLQPITKANVNEVIANHKTQLIKEYIDWLKFQVTLEHFKNI